MADDEDVRRGEKRKKSKRVSHEEDERDVVVECKVEEESGSGGGNDAEISDVEDDGHFPHLLHLRHPKLIDSKSKMNFLKAEGYRIRIGKFSKREAERLDSNMSELMNSQPVSDFWTTKEEYDDVHIALLGLFSRTEATLKLKRHHILGRAKKDLCPSLRPAPGWCTYTCRHR